jgi:hypothetical protein
MADSDRIPQAVETAPDPVVLIEDGPDGYPEGRYGGRGRPRRRTYVLSGLGIALLTAAVSWYGLRSANPAISPTVLGYTVVSDQVTTVTFELVKPASQAVACAVEALDVNSVDVGRATVTVPAGQHDVTRTVTLRTSARAITGEVVQCDPTG